MRQFLEAKFFEGFLLCGEGLVIRATDLRGVGQVIIAGIFQLVVVGEHEGVFAGGLVRPDLFE